jgi:hypothetical protein
MSASKAIVFGVGMLGMVPVVAALTAGNASLAVRPAMDGGAVACSHECPSSQECVLRGSYLLCVAGDGGRQCQVFCATEQVCRSWVGYAGPVTGCVRACGRDADCGVGHFCNCRNPERCGGAVTHTPEDTCVPIRPDDNVELLKVLRRPALKDGGRL